MITRQNQSAKTSTSSTDVHTSAHPAKRVRAWGRIADFSGALQANHSGLDGKMIRCGVTGVQPVFQLRSQR
jgi:hypothetical protein